ncbi:MAG: hypothetical protein ABL958_15065, partial [Bdellovibrionia bacterium]
MGETLSRPDAERERMTNLKRIATLSTLLYVVPLFFAGAVGDYFYLQEYFDFFWQIRVLSVVMIITLAYQIRRAKTLQWTQRLATLLILFCCLPLHTMLFIVPDAGTPIYAALILAVIGVASVFRFIFGYYFLNLAIAIVPALVAGYWKLQPNDQSHFFLNAYFLLSAALICTISRHFNEEIYQKEIAARTQLADEVTNREAIIVQLAAEGVVLGTYKFGRYFTGEDHKRPTALKKFGIVV